MNEIFSAFVRVLTAVLWGPHVLLLILLAGVWFTLRGRFMQVTKLPGMTRGALCGTQRCGGFSAFQSLTASLAGSLGTGNILGVAAAILVGGAGAVVVGEGFPAGAISVGRRIFRQRAAVLSGKVPPKPRLYLVHRHADHHVLIGVHLLAP